MAWIMVAGLAIAQLLTFSVIRYERAVSMRAWMVSGLEQDAATAVAVLDRLPAAERSQWLHRLERRHFHFALDAQPPSPLAMDTAQQQFASTIAYALSPFVVEAMGPADSGVSPSAVSLLVRLGDGSPLRIEARRVDLPLSAWVLWVLLIELLILAACAWLVVWFATRPLAQLAAAADGLVPALKGQPLSENGPSEVAHAARAFNAMQQRIACYMAERMGILAAVSHDLQTPITRLRLRVDLMEDPQQRDKWRHDLEAMQALVREGVDYARSLHGATEPQCRIDADALLESLVADYMDAGTQVVLHGRLGRPVVARPQALRRILGNLIDNACRFASDVHLHAEVEPGFWTLVVTDNGPGMAEHELTEVLKPFYRLEASRNRHTGGTGLGLAIAHQLALAMGARLSLHNRVQGGLEARLCMLLVLAEEGSAVPLA